LQVPILRRGFALNFDVQVNHVWLAFAGRRFVGEHISRQVIWGLRLPGAVGAIEHHLGDLGVNKGAGHLLLDAVAQRIAPELELGVGIVDLGVDGERGAVLQAEPVLECLVIAAKI
jgi:hypothetical protein